MLCALWYPRLEMEDRSSRQTPPSGARFGEGPSNEAYTPRQMAARVESAGVLKARLDTSSTLALGFLGGAFIGLGADFAAMAVLGMDPTQVPTRLLGALAFSLGLILVIVGGAELFTGNNLISMAWASHKITTGLLLRNWALVFVGNSLGAVSTAFAVHLSGQWRLEGGAAGTNAVKLALAKVSLEPGEAFLRGALGNVLVCLAVWLCFSARSTADKILSIVFPVTAFVACGFEHSIANLFLVPLGLFLRDQVAPMAMTEGLCWTTFLTRNLLPVTAGNIVGGSLFVGGVYWFIYLRPRT